MPELVCVVDPVGKSLTAPNRQAATGTDSQRATADEATQKLLSSLAPILAPTRRNQGQLETFADNPAAGGSARNEPATLAASCLPVKRKEPLSVPDNGSQSERVNGLEPSTSSLGS